MSNDYLEIYIIHHDKIIETMILPIKTDLLSNLMDEELPKIIRFLRIPIFSTCNLTTHPRPYITLTLTALGLTVLSNKIKNMDSSPLILYYKKNIPSKL